MRKRVIPLSGHLSPESTGACFPPAVEAVIHYVVDTFTGIERRFSPGRESTILQANLSRELAGSRSTSTHLAQSRASALGTTHSERLSRQTQGIHKIPLQFQKFIIKANGKTDKWKLLQNETYIFKLFLPHLIHLYMDTISCQKKN